MQNRLPTVIFVEDNVLSPFIPQLLSKVTPSLKNFGYKNFYNNDLDAKPEELVSEYKKGETASELCLQKMSELIPQLVTLFKNKIAENSTLAKIINDLIDFLKKTIEQSKNESMQLACTVYIKVLACIKETLSDYNSIKLFNASKENYENEIKEHFEEILKTELVARRNLHCCGLADSMQNFLINVLPQNQITYHNINILTECDLDLQKLKISEENSFEEKKTKIENLLQKAEEPKNLTNKNSLLVNGYLQAAEGSFCKIGLISIKEMQEMILKNNIDRASDFHFIYVYDSIVPPLHPIVLKARNNTLNLPLGMTLIDAKDQTLDQIALAVSVDISNKILLLNNASEKIDLDNNNKNTSSKEEIKPSMFPRPKSPVNAEVVPMTEDEESPRQNRKRRR